MTSMLLLTEFKVTNTAVLLTKARSLYCNLK
jgi:hypothetical protein